MFHCCWCCRTFFNFFLQCFLCEHNKKKLFTTIKDFPACFSCSVRLSLYTVTLFWIARILDSGSAGYTLTAGGNSLCFIRLAANGSWDDNSGMKALIIFCCLQERYCFFSAFIGRLCGGLRVCGGACLCWSTGLRDVCVTRLQCRRWLGDVHHRSSTWGFLYMRRH